MQRFRAGPLSFTAPSSWQDITLGQYLTLADPDAPDEALFTITTLAGLTAEQIRKEKAPFDLPAFVLQHLTFINQAPEVPDHLPNSLTIDGQTIALPDDLGSVALIGQMWDIELAISARQKDNMPVDPATMASLLLPVFLWPQMRTEPYQDHHQATAELWPILQNLSCVDGLAASGFFLRNSLVPSSSGKISVSPLLPIRSNSWRQRVRQAWQRIKITSLVSS